MSRSELSEHDIQKQILDWLKLKRIFHWRNNTGAVSGEYKGKKRFIRFGPKGAPDIFAVVKGRLFGIEVKRPGEKLSPAQEVFERELREAGGCYILAWSFEDVEFMSQMFNAVDKT